MRNPHWGALGALTATLGVILGVAAPALSQKPAEKPSLRQAVARKTKVAPEDVAKVLDALGPAIRDQLANGEVVELPGLGTLRVVRLPAHRDLVKGRPTTIEATNNVEFLPAASVIDAANSQNAVPSVTVPQFEFNPLPDQVKGQRTPGTRAPNDRIR